MSEMVKVLRWKGKEHEVRECCQCRRELPLSGYRGRRMGSLLEDWCLDCLVALRKEVEQAEGELYGAKCGGCYGEKPKKATRESRLTAAALRALGASAGPPHPCQPSPIAPGRFPYPVDPADPLDPPRPSGLQPVDPYPGGHLTAAEMIALAGLRADEMARLIEGECPVSSEQGKTIHWKVYF